MLATLRNKFFSHFLSTFKKNWFFLGIFSLKDTKSYWTYMRNNFSFTFWLVWNWLERSFLFNYSKKMWGMKANKMTIRNGISFFWNIKSRPKSLIWVRKWVVLLWRVQASCKKILLFFRALDSRTKPISSAGDWNWCAGNDFQKRFWKFPEIRTFICEIPWPINLGSRNEI